MPIELKNVKFADLRKYSGTIMIHVYGDTNKCLAFTPLHEPVACGIRCECGHAVMNATNFVNLIHFCPNRKLQSVTVTDHLVRA
jgi:hypothetical protein